MGMPGANLEYVPEESLWKGWPKLSPDGQWLAFGNEGRLTFQRSDGTGDLRYITVKTQGHIRWSKNNDRVFYVNRGAIWSIELTWENGAINLSRPEEVVELPYFFVPNEWDINSDETRFLILVEDIDETEVVKGPGSPNTVNLVLNWFTELNQKLPVDKK